MRENDYYILTMLYEDIMYFNCFRLFNAEPGPGENDFVSFLDKE